MTRTPIYPFSAIIGQDLLKRALVIGAINPSVGGVLIRGEKGTAKSTAVRALAALLPFHRQIRDCPFACDPDQPMDLCPQCRNRKGTMVVAERRPPVVTLPLNATEDRVAGGIDFNQTMQSGVRSFQPGLLAAAHRGILYVDEVNLLDDHLVDIILDAAASGRNVVEREGISFAHSCTFLLVGTMNPEEGELRPQFLDRFGLCVDVTSEMDPDKRVALMRQREAYDCDPRGTVLSYAERDQGVESRIASARERLPRIRMRKDQRDQVCQMCTENNVAGHRADLIIEQAARGLAAYRSRQEVAWDDILDAAHLALTHRKREAAPPPREQEKEPEKSQDQAQDSYSEGQGRDQDHGRDDQRQQEEAEGLEEKVEQEQSSSKEKDSGQDSRNQEGSSQDQTFDVGPTFQVRRLSAPKDRIVRRGSGRRSRTRVAQRQGRYVKSSQLKDDWDVALDATLRAAAPHQLRRNNPKGLAITVRPPDIRGKIREKRIGNFLLFLVDASGSMGAKGRMAASKGAVMSLLLDAYQKRDRVGMISFRREEAVVNLPPTSSIELAATCLQNMPVGGRTPLSAGLAKTFLLLRSQLLREPTTQPIVLIITDGKTNVSLGQEKPMQEALQMAGRMAGDERITSIVVDTESQGLVTFGLAQHLAQAMQAHYFQINDLKAQTLVHIAQETRR
jgi:magnesium chelatase subunit D